MQNRSYLKQRFTDFSAQEMLHTHKPNQY